ncbi:MAG: hypothetical protein K9L70_07995 [Thiohalocapsa sp.]|nr:hypothetical protein [Thiohalocapsa sp.]
MSHANMLSCYVALLCLSVWSRMIPGQVRSYALFLARGVMEALAAGYKRVVEDAVIDFSCAAGPS